VEIGERVAAAAPSHGLSLDIRSMGLGEYLVGDDWLRFLLESRWVLGVEGGASINDRDGKLMGSEPPPGRDGELDYRALSPRHLEAAVARTGQILIEGGYNGALQPGAHYLELRRDFSNLDEVLEAARDEPARIEMVERARRDIVDSGRYSYAAFAQQVATAALRDVPRSATTRLSAREKALEFAFTLWSDSWLRGRSLARRALVVPARRAAAALRTP
jgi:hypothetical protein